MRLVVATRSAHKLREIRTLLGSLPGLRLQDLNEAAVPESAEEEGIEVFDTFAANALAKARYFGRLTGAWVLSDDSGLCVEALSGAPGVRSKRFSGRIDLRGDALDRANNEHLLAALQGVPVDQRTACYVCAAALVGPRGEEAVFHGICTGRIEDAPRGDQGFGYDPLFLLPSRGATFGQLPASEKDRVSHRARAMRKVSRVLDARRATET